MRFKFLLAVAVLTSATQLTYAQYVQDALRFSRSTQGTTARMKGLGNATTALGGDLSSVSTNPAGLGFFNRSEFSFTPEYNMTSADATYWGHMETADKNQMNFNNASVVFNTKSRVGRGQDATQGFLNFNFGLSWNRTNNFYNKLNYSGTNGDNSIADYFAELANEPYGLEDYPEAAWGVRHQLVRLNGNLYVPNTARGADQYFDQATTGGQNEFSVSMGTNYSNKLYLGLGLGFTSLRYRSNSTFTESNDINTLDVGSNQTVSAVPYDSFYDVTQRTNGSGFNLKLGMIYKPVSSVQLGASFTSPTWYSIEDHTSYALQTNVADPGRSYIESPEAYNYNYNLRTPMKVSGGMAVFFKQSGFITADVEYVDYEGMKISDTPGAENDNANIAKLYQSTVNARLGAEGRLNPNVYLRAGYNYQGNPEREIGSAINTYSGGIGYRGSNFYVDATYANSSWKQQIYPYELYNSPTASPEADVKRKYNNVYLTIGFRF
ncbi:OmpP1/FadL family transporter [Arcticibacter sp. MXS-1]|uniref:OmpP1/FadL family transporter n=1 Tax=Arcticibacter sp. MXS-1 TaxID=3341726 RepID=UPI0035A8336D